MKNVLLSADSVPCVYSVPDIVADDLCRYCMDFCNDWIWNDPEGAKLLRTIDGVQVAYFDETDFIDYLNQWLFPEEKSELVREFDDYDEITDEYDALPHFNF